MRGRNGEVGWWRCGIDYNDLGASQGRCHEAGGIGMGSAAVRARLLATSLPQPIAFLPMSAATSQSYSPNTKTLCTQKQGSADEVSHPIAGVDSDAIPSAMLRDSAMTPMVMPAITSCATDW